MIYVSIALFSIAALLGLTVLIQWLRKKEAPKGVVYSHGGVAIIALVILIVYSIMHPQHFPLISLALFPMGAIAGIYMFFTYKGDGRKRPVSVAFIHAFFVLSGFIALLVFAFTGEKL
jgi:hypothetical protein